MVPTKEMIEAAAKAGAVAARGVTARVGERDELFARAALEAALAVAPVPDAATEQITRLSEGMREALEVGERAVAERDAAVAAMAQLRAGLQSVSYYEYKPHKASSDLIWAVGVIDAALDGAPEPGREAQLERAARELNRFGWTCHGGTHEPGDYDTCEDCQTVCMEVARSAFHGMSGTPHLSADQVWSIAQAEHDYANDSGNVPAFVISLVDSLRVAGVPFDEQPFIDSGYLRPVERGDEAMIVDESIPENSLARQDFEENLAELIEGSAGEWGDATHVPNVLAQYIAKDVAEWLRGDGQ